MAQDPQQMQGQGNKHDQVVAKILHTLQEKQLDIPTMQKMYGLATSVLKNPQSYPQARQQAIATGKLTEKDLPPQYDEKYISALAFALQIGLKAVDDAKTHKPQQAQQQPLQMPKSI